MYPTLLDLCGLPQNDALEGHSLLPQLQDATAQREWPAITTNNHDNHGIRTKDWRFIQYADGSEELYNMQNDPNEFKNLAVDNAYASVLEEHRKWIPKSRQPVPGSAHRILLHRADGSVNWEGEEVGSEDPIPELD